MNNVRIHWYHVLLGIGINNESIKDYNHLLELEDNCYNNKGNCIVKVYRNGQIKDLIVNFEQ